MTIKIYKGSKLDQNSPDSVGFANFQASMLTESEANLRIMEAINFHINSIANRYGISTQQFEFYSPEILTKFAMIQSNGIFQPLGFRD